MYHRNGHPYLAWQGKSEKKNGQLQITTKMPLKSHRKYDFNLSAIVLTSVLSIFQLHFCFGHPSLQFFQCYGYRCIDLSDSVSLQITLLAKALNYFPTFSTCVSQSVSLLLLLFLSNILDLVSTLLFPSYAFVYTQHESLSAYKCKWGYNAGVMFIDSLSKRKILMAFSRH